MTAEIIDGVRIAGTVHAEVRQRIAAQSASLSGRPGLAVVLIGADPASRSYVRRKERACEEVGIFTETLTPPADVSQEELIRAVGDLNADARFSGILVQLPLPDHIDQDAVIGAIDPRKDVDGLHPENAGLLMRGDPRFVPATPLGVQRMLREQGVQTSGAEVVIVGRSSLVGRPLSLLLTARGNGGDATVTICHTRTRDLATHTRRADVVVAAAGAPGAITADMLDERAVVIDVGVSRVADASRKSGYRLAGDVDFASASDRVAAITPVPGGVGPMTVAMLLQNAVLAWELQATSA